jgi:3-oxoacyl-[acyl-carrier protein] reductase
MPPERPVDMSNPRTFLVTGCASGIGRSLARRLHRLGHSLLATDVNDTGLRSAAETDGWAGSESAIARVLDVRDPRAWREVVAEVVDRWGRLDVLINVAGVLAAIWAQDTSDAQVEQIIDINTKGVMHGTNAGLRVMVPHRSGHVVNVASLAGVIPIPGLALYSASKHAVRAYSIAVAQEVRRCGVFVTAVCPTVVRTPMMDIQIDREEAAITFSGRRPLEPDEVTSAIVNRALVRKPLELLVDAPGSWQGLAAKIGNAVPTLGLWLGERVAKTGRAQQARLARSARKT